MNYNLILLFFSCLLFSCNTNSGETENNSSDSSTTAVAPIIERDNFFKENEQVLIKQYFDAKWVDSLSDNMYAFRDAKTDVEVEKAFISAQILQEQMEKSLGEEVEGYPIYAAMSALDSVMSPFVSTCVAECTGFAFSFSMTELRKFAENTTGKSDNSFCDLMELASGKMGGRTGDWYNFIERTWDYGGGTVLGNGLCQDFLEKSWSHSQRTPLFRTHIMAVRESCIANMSHPIYMQKKEAVLAELSKILSAQILTAEEKNKLDALQTKLQAEDDKSQYDCAKGDCDWGG